MSNNVVRVIEPIDNLSRRQWYDVFNLHTSFEGFDLIVRADLRNEFWTISFISDISKSSPNVEDWEVYTLIKAKLQALKSMALGKSESVDIAGISNALYNEFSNLLEEKVFARFQSGFSHSRSVQFGNIGNCIADFRGAIIGVAVKRNTKRAYSASQVPETEIELEFQSFSDMKAGPGQRRPLQARMNYQNYSVLASLVVIERLWPVIKQIFHRRTAKADYFGKPELTISRLIGCRAIYMTALGRVFDSIPAVRREPVRDLLVVDYPSRWQIGRLVDRIHGMGVARLAALYNLIELQEVSNVLRSLHAK